MNETLFWKTKIQECAFTVMKLKNLVLSSTAALALFAVSAKVANADTVKAGDTVSAIAAANHTTVDAIASANHLKNVNLIFVGDKLEVNGTTTTASSVATSQAPKTNNQATSASSTTTSQATPVSYTASSNNGASTQSEVLSQMQSRTGVSAATWNRIITRESNWNSTVKNGTSGAYGLFQNMHISSGSTQDQVNAAVSLYQSQGMSAWGE